MLYPNNKHVWLSGTAFVTSLVDKSWVGDWETQGFSVLRGECQDFTLNKFM